MEYRISDKMRTLKPSAIREIFKYAGDPSVISLAGGNPAPESLPVEDIQRLMGEVLRDNPMNALLYGQSEGYPPFREALKDYLRRTSGSFQEFDDLIVITGAQQGMDLVCKVLCDEGDTVLCEDPSFIGALNTFRSYHVNLVGVPMEEDGLSLAALEQAMREHKARFLYLIPNFQNPSGITMSLEKRKRVYQLAKQYGTLILEDNPYGDLRFTGEPIPTIKSMDRDGLVIYVGGFSKILSTGIRVAYLVAPQGLMPKLVVAKQCTDVHTSMPMQLLCHRFLTECDIDGHIQGIKSIYSRKCGLMLREMEEQFPANVSFTRPEGGLFVWVTLPPHVDGVEFSTRLVREKKVCVVPGSAFCADDTASSHAIRLNFSANGDETMVQGVLLTAELLREVCGE